MVGNSYFGMTEFGFEFGEIIIAHEYHRETRVIVHDDILNIYIYNSGIDIKV